MFLQKYKELDNLCKDLLNSEKGVSSYIESMEQCAYSRKIVGWEDDYRNLKKYRYMRNRIVHENNVDEETLCSETDEMWLEQFHERIINCEDPLALHRQYKMSFHQYPQGQKRQTNQNASVLEDKDNVVRKTKWVSYIIGALIILIVIVGLTYVLK